MRRSWVTLAALLSSACSLAPDYRPPAITAPAQYKEAPGWAAATPLDAAPRGQWWQAFGDPVLDDLVARAERASPTLAAALARYDQARATARIEGAALLPTVDADASIARERLSGNRPVATGGATTYNVGQVGGTLSYEIDLWGRIRNRVRAAKAEADASDADLVAAKLSIAANVADAYLRLRGLDAEARLLQRSADAFQRAYDLTSTRHDGGLASGVDVNRSRTLLGNARAQIAEVANQRATTEHELAALTGEVASTFSIAPVDHIPAPPAYAQGLPSELLQRRPDVAAAERRMLAANARIGVARAAYFPTLDLAGSGGVQAARGDLFSSPSVFWGLGPLSTVLNLFDGGRRRAQERLSRAEYDELAAGYRDTVLGAFREVEDSLAAQRLLAQQAVEQRGAADAAARTSDLALTRYRDGAADYLEVTTAQTDALVAARATLSVETRRARAAVALVRALGGTPQPEVPEAGAGG